MPKQWEIWYANFSFEDEPSKIKKRPVLILNNNGSFPILVAKITKTKPRQGYYGEYKIAHWEKAGLKHPSTIRLSKKLMLEKSDLFCKIGKLDPFDIMKLQEIITKNT